MASRDERGIIESAHDVCLGFDVGKSFHWACAPGDGDRVVDRQVTSARDDVRPAIDEARGAAGPGSVLVTVDRRNNIGSLVVREARDMGCDVAYPPGLAEKRSRDMFPRLAKDDRLDAWVIAHASEAPPQAPPPVPDAREARMIGSQRRCCVRLATQARNRLHSAPLEGDPELEAACDLSKPRLVGLLAELGGADGIASATRRRHDAPCSSPHAPADEAEALRAIAERSVANGWHPGREDGVTRWLADSVGNADAEAERPRRQAHGLLEDDLCHQCLLTVPGVGPVLAEALVSLVDVSLFESHDQLAPICGVTPANSGSGTSIDRVASSRGGNKELKDLLILTCNSLVNSKGHFGRYYREVYDRSSGDHRLRHRRALKAVARKRLKVIFAVMRDLVPYDASRWEKTA